MRFIEYPEEGITQGHLVYDRDSQPINATFTCTIDVNKVTFDPYNQYMQPEVWIYMGDEIPVDISDGDPFAKFKQVIFRTVNATNRITDSGGHYLDLQMNDALLELLDENEISAAIAVNPGDKVTDKIKMLLQGSVIPKWSLTDSTEVIINPKTFTPGTAELNQDDTSVRTQEARWQVGTSVLQVIDDLCDQIHYIRYSDLTGTLIIRPWRDPASETPIAVYEDDGNDPIFIETQSRQDIYRLPNELVFYSVPQGDQEQIWVATAKNLSPLSPISQVNLKAPNGQPLIKHSARDGIEATSQVILQEKVDTQMKEFAATPETLDFRSRFKPYHRPYDVILLTRLVLGYDSARFEVSKVEFDLNVTSVFQMLLKRVVTLK